MNATLTDRTVLVTGANGGLGRQFVQQALERGARKVYAAARTSHDWGDGRIQPLPLDVTESSDVDAAVAVASDVDLVVNNAGTAPVGDVISGPEDAVRTVFETNFFGALRVATAFAPVLGRNGGGALVNVLSAAAWIPVPTAYAASKAAMWSSTNALRVHLEGQGTQVVGLMVGMVDTPMSARWDVPKVSAHSVVEQTYDGLAAGLLEVLADETTKQLKDALHTPAEQLYPWLHEQVRGFSA